MFLTKENWGGNRSVNTLETIRYAKGEGISGRKPLAKLDKDYTVATAGGQEPLPKSPLGNDRHRFQNLDSILQRRMGAKQR